MIPLPVNTCYELFHPSLHIFKPSHYIYIRSIRCRACTQREAVMPMHASGRFGLGGVAAAHALLYLR